MSAMESKPEGQIFPIAPISCHSAIDPIADMGIFPTLQLCCIALVLP